MGRLDRVPVATHFMLLYVGIFCFLNLVGGDTYVLDDTHGVGRRFDGIGGLSGGGATSKLLVNYPDKYRQQILDYLFKPGFGASLQILKVEIGGDSQSTDGTESSHMHEAWDESYDRGYEWWLMVQAKKINPAIKLYGLPWAFPGWLGFGTSSPYTNPNATADYIVKWVLGAKAHYGLVIDYLGVWNERNYNVTYIKVLRDALDTHGLSHIELVAPDGGWGISKDILLDPLLAKDVTYIGAHYPGTMSSLPALETGKQLWSSEDYSTFNDDVGAGCWARILNQNYVNGFMTSTISWNLIASYYQNLPFGGDGLMTAQEPWSGHYRVESPIWITAHTTHFTSIGWNYLLHGSGVGKLSKGGSYVSLMSPDKSHFTMVIETMSHNHSVCIRPRLPAYTVSHQVATFQLEGALAKIPHLYIWYSKLVFGGKSGSILFKKSSKPISVINGTFMVSLNEDELYTLTTVDKEPPKLYPASPQSKTFPLPYRDDFEAYPINSEAYNFVPQTGVWEVRSSGEKKGHGKVNRQVILQTPCSWCNTGPYPINIGGNHNWSDVYVQLDVQIPSVNSTKGIFLAARVSNGGCSQPTAKGVFFHLELGSNNFTVSGDLKLTKILKQGQLQSPIEHDKWYHMSLITRGSRAYGYLDTQDVFSIDLPAKPSHGFVAYGAATYGLADYDNLLIKDPGESEKSVSDLKPNISVLLE